MSFAPTLALLACLALALSPVARAAVLAWSGTVAVSRVVYGRHHLLDVAAGVAVGLLEFNLHVGSMWVGAELAGAWQADLAAPVLPVLAARFGL